MSMFVEENEIVEITVCYVCKEKKIEIIEVPTQESKTLTVVFKQPDFSTSQRLIASSTVVNENGEPTVNLMALQSNMIYFLAKSWDAKTSEGKPIPLTNENIGRLKVEVARALINKLSKEVGQLV